MSITALSGLAMVTGGVFSIRKTKPNRSTLCWRRIMESNHHRFRNGTVFKTAWAPCPLSSVVLYVFTKRLQAKIFKYSPRVEEGFHSDLIGCMESFNRCGHGAVTTMAITRRIMNPWPQRWDHWDGLMYLALHVCRFCLCDAKTSGLNVACWLT